MDHDTIAAISSAVSESGIGIIRISGSEAIRTADKIFRSKSGKRNLSDFKSHSVHYGLNLIQKIIVAEEKKRWKIWLAELLIKSERPIAPLFWSR